MDFKQIQELIKIVNRSNIGELSIEEGDFKITIKQKEDPAPVSATAPAPVQSYSPPALPVPTPSAAVSNQQQLHHNYCCYRQRAR